MKNLILIGLAGPMKSGKDTVADYLVQTNPQASKIGFADTIREEVVSAFRLENDLCLTIQDEKDLPNASLALKYCLDGDFVNFLIARYEPLDCTIGPTIPRTPRWIQQQWGDYQRATKGWDYFIESVRSKVMRQATRHAAFHTLVVVSGLRFAASAPNPMAEAELIRSMGGEVWHIQRPGFSHHPTHTTEIPLPIENGDRVILNDSDLNELHFAAADLLCELFVSKHQAEESWG
jgi:hypothetical protein